MHACTHAHIAYVVPFKRPSKNTYGCHCTDALAARTHASVSARAYAHARERAHHKQEMLAYSAATSTSTSIHLKHHDAREWKFRNRKHKLSAQCVANLIRVARESAPTEIGPIVRSADALNCPARNHGDEQAYFCS
jgi:hypothetical protein